VGLYEPTRGGLTFDGEDAHAAFKSDNAKAMRKRIQMIFQDPYASLNPRWKVEDIIGEPLKEHGLIHDEQELKARVAELLQSVGLSALDMVKYPHQFSGGMRQRVMIAMALSCKPKLLIADEPTTALDVTIQAQILDLLNELKSQMGMSIMLITHAMGVVAETAQRVVVMYAGRVVEEASVEKLFASPAHPYTKGLIRSIPRIDFDSDHKQRLEAIPGSVPKLINPPMGCRFAPRCQYASDRCTQEMPELRQISTGHSVACHFSL